MADRQAWNTPHTWTEVDPSGNKMNAKSARQAAKEQAAEDAKWKTMTEAELKAHRARRGKVYAIERDGKNWRVKVKR